MRFTILLAAALCASAVSPAAAQDAARIDVPAAASWKHAGSGLVLRPGIAGYPRGTIVDSSGSELDVMVQYAEGGATSVTLNIFRPSVMSVPMWFDRSETQILLRSDAYGTPVPAGPARAFTPPHADAASGLQRVYVPGSGAYKSTGLAMIPLGEWLVAVRASSTELDPAALDARLGEIVGGIVWPDKVAASPAAVPVAACAGVLAYDPKAKPKKPDMGQALMGAALVGMGQDKAGEGDKAYKDQAVEEASPPPVWCREGTPTSDYGVYRADNADNGYLLAAGDAGVTIGIAPAFPLEGKKVGYTLSVGTLDRTFIYPNFDRLPAPQTAFDAIQRLKPMSSVRRGSKELTISM
ncbi:hypothetical protein ACCC88_16385 [Sphingomonas sp. Sphisp140]|uniref:hypothetical protein n=1 Tax=unclassified Sphingomonas TaxID=196159 RepID=UPI0039B0755B